VPVFLVVTFALTWAVWVPRALGVQVGLIGRLWTWAPAWAALGCAAVMYGRLGEELAWRGYLLPRLLIRHRAVSASLILGVIWWLWHLPLVWTAGAAIEGRQLWLLLADLMAMSLIFTYVFLGTTGSVLIAILLHAATNLFAVSPPSGPDGDLTVPLVALVMKIVLVTALFLRLPRSFGDGRSAASLPMLADRQRD